MSSLMRPRPHPAPLPPPHLQNVSHFPTPRRKTRHVYTHPATLDTWLDPAKHPHSLNRLVRERELERITTENRAFLGRLRNQSATYNHVKMEQDFRESRRLVQSISEFPSPRTTKKRTRRRATSVTIPRVPIGSTPATDQRAMTERRAKPAPTFSTASGSQTARVRRPRGRPTEDSVATPQQATATDHLQPIAQDPAPHSELPDEFESDFEAEPEYFPEVDAPEHRESTPREATPPRPTHSAPSEVVSEPQIVQPVKPTSAQGTGEEEAPYHTSQFPRMLPSPSPLSVSVPGSTPFGAAAPLPQAGRTGPHRAEATGPLADEEAGAASLRANKHVRQRGGVHVGRVSNNPHIY